MSTPTRTNQSSDAAPSRDTQSAVQQLPSSESSFIGVGEDQPLSPLEKLYRGVTSPERLLPDFLIIGTQRGGTTSLYHYLQAHPAVHSSAVKDTHFFDKKFHKGV